MKYLTCAVKSVEWEAEKWDKPHLKEGFLPLYQYPECSVNLYNNSDKSMVPSVLASSKRELEM